LCRINRQNRAVGAEPAARAPLPQPASGNKLNPMEPPPEDQDRSVTDALRKAIERTLAATAPAAAQTRERAAGLVDELARRGREASAELARRAQEAGEGISRRGQDARSELSKLGQDAGAEVARRLEALERRLASLEEAIRQERAGKPDEQGENGPSSNSPPEG